MAKKHRVRNPEKFLREKGLLGWVNKEFFHTFGLELGIDSDGMVYVENQQSHPDQNFPPDVFERLVAQFRSFMESEGNAIRAKRKELLGYVIQGENGK